MRHEKVAPSRPPAAVVETRGAASVLINPTPTSSCGAGTAAATSSDEGQTIEVEAFENQRYYPIKGWTANLLPTDRPRWSSRDGRAERRLDAAALPGYHWVGGWALQIDLGDDACAGTTDSEGWQYAFDFPREYRAFMGGHSWVRRRRWVRHVRPPDLVLRDGGVGKLVDDGRFVLIDDLVGDAAAGPARQLERSFLSEDAASASTQDEAAVHRFEVRSLTSGPTSSLDSCCFPDETAVTVSTTRSGATTPSAASHPSASLPTSPVHAKEPAHVRLALSPKSEVDPVQYILSRWLRDKGARQGSVTLRVHSVHLAQPFASCYVMVGMAGKALATPGASAQNHRVEFRTPKQQLHFMVASDCNPMVLTVIDDSSPGGLRRCAGEAVLSLRTPPSGSVRMEAFPDGRYSEHGEAIELPLFPPPSGTKAADEALYTADALGRITVSWHFELRDDMLFPERKDVCESCARPLRQCRCGKTAEQQAQASETGTGSAVEDPGVPPPTAKSGRIVLRVISGKGLIDHTDGTGAAGVPYLRRKRITPYVVLRYCGAGTSGPPDRRPPADAAQQQMIRSSKAAGEARDDSDVTWGETLVADVADCYSAVCPLRLEVWDYNTFESNKFQGMAFVDPVRQNGSVVQLKLRQRDDENDPFVLSATSLGSLVVRIDWIPFTL